MSVQALDFFELKPEFLPANFAWYGVYVRPGELDLYAEPDQWKFVGRTFHPNLAQAEAVERKGYCERSLPSGFDWGRIGRTWYDHPSSVRVREGKH
jgi:hypothetical protein